MLRELELRGGVATFGALVACGVSRRALGAAVAAGVIERPVRGVYCTPGADMRLVRAVRLDSALTCVSACEVLGLPLLSPDSRAHIAVRRSTSVARVDAVRPHYVSGTLPLAQDTAGSMRRPRGQGMGSGIAGSGSGAVFSGSPMVFSGSRANAGGLGATTALGTRALPVWRVVDHLAACVGKADQLVVLDAALNRRMMTASDVDLFACTPATRRGWLTAFADPGAQSLIETLARLALRQAGLTVQAQVLVEGVGRVDLVVEGVVAVELDGRDYHSNERAFREDRRRDRELSLRGMPVLRFTYQDVRFRTAQMVADVTAMCTRVRTRQ